MKRLAVALVLPLLLAAPGTAAADVIFDPADADDLAATLAEAYTDQGVCYGWHVTVDNVGSPQESVGSNFGAGKTVSSGSCAKKVEFTANITYTSESSESEDSASYDVSSTPAGVGRDDLDALDIDFDGLTGEDPDVAIGKAVTALPLLAADKGLAKALAASPDTASAPADAQLTDDPGSDWWRERGGMLLWGVGLMLAGGVFVWWVLRTNRPHRRPSHVQPVPDDLSSLEPLPYEPPAEPPVEQAEEPPAAPPVEPPAPPGPPIYAPPPPGPPLSGPPAEETEPGPDAEPAPKTEAAAKPEAESASGSDAAPAPEPDEQAAGESEQARPAPSDLKDKE